MNHYVLPLNNRPFLAIKARNKKVEYRVNTEFDDVDYSQISKGDSITFVDELTGKRLEVKVVRVSHYKDATSMYKEEGLQNSSSNPETIEKAVERIQKFTGYREGIKKNGIYAIEIEID